MVTGALWKSEVLPLYSRSSGAATADGGTRTSLGPVVGARGGDETSGSNSGQNAAIGAEETRAAEFGSSSNRDGSRILNNRNAGGPAGGGGGAGAAGRDAGEAIFAERAGAAKGRKRRRLSRAGRIVVCLLTMLLMLWLVVLWRWLGGPPVSLSFRKGAGGRSSSSAVEEKEQSEATKKAVQESDTDQEKHLAHPAAEENTGKSEKRPKPAAKKKKKKKHTGEPPTPEHGRMTGGGQRSPHGNVATPLAAQQTTYDSNTAGDVTTEQLQSQKIPSLAADGGMNAESFFLSAAEGTASSPSLSPEAAAFGGPSAGVLPPPSPIMSGDPSFTTSDALSVGNESWSHPGASGEESADNTGGASFFDPGSLPAAASAGEGAPSGKLLRRGVGSAAATATNKNVRHAKGDGIGQEIMSAFEVFSATKEQPHSNGSQEASGRDRSTAAGEPPAAIAESTVGEEAAAATGKEEIRRELQRKYNYDSTSTERTVNLNGAPPVANEEAAGTAVKGPAAVNAPIKTDDGPTATAQLENLKTAKRKGFDVTFQEKKKGSAGTPVAQTVEQARGTEEIRSGEGGKEGDGSAVTAATAADTSVGSTEARGTAQGLSHDGRGEAVGVSSPSAANAARADERETKGVAAERRPSSATEGVAGKEMATAANAESSAAGGKTEITAADRLITRSSGGKAGGGVASEDGGMRTPEGHRGSHKADEDVSLHTAAVRVEESAGGRQGSFKEEKGKDLDTSSGKLDQIGNTSVDSAARSGKLTPAFDAQAQERRSDGKGHVMSQSAPGGGGAAQQVYEARGKRSSSSSYSSRGQQKEAPASDDLMDDEFISEPQFPHHTAAAADRNESGKPSTPVPYEGAVSGQSANSQPGTSQSADTASAPDKMKLTSAAASSEEKKEGRDRLPSEASAATKERTTATSVWTAEGQARDPQGTAQEASVVRDPIIAPEEGERKMKTKGAADAGGQMTLGTDRSRRFIASEEEGDDEEEYTMPGSRREITPPPVPVGTYGRGRKEGEQKESLQSKHHRQERESLLSSGLSDMFEEDDGNFEEERLNRLRQQEQQWAQQQRQWLQVQQQKQQQRYTQGHPALQQEQLLRQQQLLQQQQRAQVGQQQQQRGTWPQRQWQQMPEVEERPHAAPAYTHAGMRSPSGTEAVHEPWDRLPTMGRKSGGSREDTGEWNGPPHLQAQNAPRPPQISQPLHPLYGGQQGYQPQGMQQQLPQHYGLPQQQRPLAQSYLQDPRAQQHQQEQLQQHYGLPHMQHPPFYVSPPQQHQHPLYGPPQRQPPQYPADMSQYVHLPGTQQHTHQQYDPGMTSSPSQHPQLYGSMREQQQQMERWQKDQARAAAMKTAGDSGTGALSEGIQQQRHAATGKGEDGYLASRGAHEQMLTDLIRNGVLGHIPTPTPGGVAQGGAVNTGGIGRSTEQGNPYNFDWQKIGQILQAAQGGRQGEQGKGLGAGFPQGFGELLRLLGNPGHSQKGEEQRDASLMQQTLERLQQQQHHRGGQEEDEETAEEEEDEESDGSLNQQQVQKAEGKGGVAPAAGGEGHGSGQSRGAEATVTAAPSAAGSAAGLGRGRVAQARWELPTELEEWDEADDMYRDADEDELPFSSVPAAQQHTASAPPAAGNAARDGHVVQGGGGNAAAATGEEPRERGGAAGRETEAAATTQKKGSTPSSKQQTEGWGALSNIWQQALHNQWPAGYDDAEEEEGDEVFHPRHLEQSLFHPQGPAAENFARRYRDSEQGRQAQQRSYMHEGFR